MEEIEKVYAASLKLLVPQPPYETYKTIVNEACKLVGAKHGSIFMPPDKSKRIKRVFTTTPRLNKIKPRKGGVTETVFKSNIPLMRSGKDLAKSFSEFEKHPVGSDITIPLSYGHIIIGALSVLGSPGTEWGLKEMNIMKAFAPIATLAIRNSMLNNDLKEAINSRDLFISLAAHEFKTPITTINLYSEMLEKKIGENKEIKYKDIKMLIKETNRLTRLINELLDITRIQQGKLEYKMKSSNLQLILEISIQNFKKKFPKHKVEYTCLDKKPYVLCDTDKLNQVFTNVLNNAGEFSGPGSLIKIILSKKGNYIVVSIKDQGIGISADNLPYIFDKYYSQRENSKSKDGMGLGLYIVKKIVEHHKGEITAKSKPKKGTEIIIKLPSQTIND